MLYYNVTFLLLDFKFQIPSAEVLGEVVCQFSGHFYSEGNSIVDNLVSDNSSQRPNYQLVTCPPLNRRKVPELFNSSFKVVITNSKLDLYLTSDYLRIFYLNPNSQWTFQIQEKFHLIFKN